MTLERMLLKSDGDYPELLARLKKWGTFDDEEKLVLDYVESKEFE